MNRRGVLLLAATAAMGWNPAAAEVKIARIGLVQPGSRQGNQDLLDSFRQGLAKHGWTDGSNIAVLDRWAEERTERLPAIVKELIGAGVSVLVTAGTPATLAARRASTTVPVVLVGVDYISAEQFGAPAPRTHQILLGRGIVIVEGLDLRLVPAGDYDLIVLPLKVRGHEAAPARAIVRKRNRELT